MSYPERLGLKTNYPSMNIYELTRQEQQDSDERRNKTRMLQIEILKRPKNFSEKLEFKIKTDLPNDETVNFAIMDSDSIWSDKPSKEDTELVSNTRLRLGSAKYVTKFTEEMQKKAFKDTEFNSAECYIMISHPKIGTVYSEIFDLEEYDFKKKKAVPKKENKNLRKYVKDMIPSSNYYLYVKELETLGYKVQYGSNKEIVKIYPYDDGGKDGVGNATIGYGHLIEKKPFDSNNPKHAKWKNGITLAEANDLLKEDTMKKIELLKNGLGDGKTKGIKVKLLQREFDALLLAIFNGGYGDTLESTINKGVENLSKEEIFKAFLTRRNKGTIFEDGLTKRRAMEADIFVNDNWQPFPSDKFPNDRSYINAYKTFLSTGVLPIFIVLMMFLNSCKQKDNSQKLNLDSKKELIEDSKQSDSLKIALSHIKTFDSGIGTDNDVIKNSQVEEESWKKEINNIYLKLHKKIEKTDPETIPALKKYHKDWQDYVSQNYTFQRSFLNHYISSKQWIFYTFPQQQKEYKNKLIEYYNLYEFDEK